MFKVSTSHLCPFCLDTFEQNACWYRCEAVPQICPKETDETYDTFFPGVTGKKRGRLIQPFLKKRSSLLKTRSTASQACDLCATPVSQRVCPTCHSDLPDSLFSAYHLPLLCYSPDMGVFDIFVANLTRKMSLISGHDVNATVKTIPGMKGFHLSFDKTALNAKNILVSFHQLTIRKQETPLFEGALFFDHIGSLFGEKSKKITLETIENICKAGLKSGSPSGLVYYGLEDYYGYFPGASAVLDTASSDFDSLVHLGEWASQEILTLAGASYGANFLRLLKNHKPWRFSACSLLEMPNVPLSSFHSIESLMFWQLEKCLS